MPKVKIIYASRYSLTGSDGNRVSGCKITYLDDRIVKEQNALGQACLTVSGDYRLFNSLSHYKVPGHFNVEFTSRPDSRGRPVLGVASINPCPESERSVTVQSSDSDDLDEMSQDIESELASVGYGDDNNGY